ncbi:MAG TPA: AbrB/MazE/SpoVT family DNA-binding domain-containing protein [Candidatus Acidoferrum sp.]|nr:AbrB/MazE/SpoVT family DNA-binding domain-containing protein [Candidatus Acidoferrum sp.]
MTETESERRLQKMGGSLICSIPKAFVKANDLHAGDVVDVSNGETVVVIRLREKHQ